MSPNYHIFVNLMFGKQKLAMNGDNKYKKPSSKKPKSYVGLNPRVKMELLTQLCTNLS